MSPARSVGTRLSIALLLVVAGALGIVYLIVVPSLETRLIHAKVSQLEHSARGLAREVPANRIDWPDWLDEASASENARVVLYDVIAPPTTLTVVGDSRSVSSKDVENDPIALESALTLQRKSGTIHRGGQRIAEAAVPLTQTGPVLLLSASLHDTLGSVHLVQRRLLIAGAIALLIAVAVGYGGAWVFARRIRRLERAAERIASGRFDEPVVDRGRDEVGQLATAFERMRERLAQLDHARREFIANASHELRTPLFSLGGFLELLTDEDLDETTRREFLVTMHEQVVRLTKLAIELLDLSRLDAGRLRVESHALDLGGLARTVADEFAGVARAEHHTLEVAVEGEVNALGDEQRVLQIARILVENALVHTAKGKSVRISASAGERAVLSVEDEGDGIPPEQQAHVFDRFYRIHGELAAGSGLGLAIARELAELMGGSLELDSEPGRTVFSLSLPLAAREPAGVAVFP